jgi:hypothetical protein
MLARSAAFALTCVPSTAITPPETAPAAAHTRRDPARTTRRLVTQLERLGYAVTLQQQQVAT